MKTKLDTILVIDANNKKERHIKAQFVKDYNLTPSTENVAWNGTLQMYVDKKGQYYLWHHTGNSAHRGAARQVPPYVLDLSAREALEFLY